ncbi:MAG TPA: aromatic ring-hydroxylating dioxygenase subunit alpha, partial [Micromonosporaceae bacterium]|nr:aromatic ring-hydroxylating dioxygenase subunit alpha [Micromonosporaceae bacterium]
DDAVLLVRGEDGLLRGFYNTCRHRGHELVPCGSAASGRFITCPYHSWVYDLDGRLHRVPPAHRADVSAGELGLVPVAVKEWAGFVFVNADGAAPPLREYLAGVVELLAPYRPERLVVAARHEYEVAANWKLAVENYHECYHCSTIHPELCRVSSPESGSSFVPGGLWLGGSMELVDGAATMALAGRRGGPPIPGLSGRRLREVLYVQVFPNLLISAHPDYVMTHLMEPIAAGRTRVVCEWLFPPEAATRAEFDPSYAVEFWDITNRQDWAACEGVQRGVASRGFRPGPLSPWHETVVAQSIAVVARAYLDGRLPAPDSIAATAARSA